MRSGTPVHALNYITGPRKERRKRRERAAVGVRRERRQGRRQAGRERGRKMNG